MIAQFIYLSAGVGRSGAFIAIDIEIQRIEKENVVDVYNCVRRMRFWRNFMVQTQVGLNSIYFSHLECGHVAKYVTLYIVISKSIKIYSLVF